MMKKYLSFLTIVLFNTVLYSQNFGGVLASDIEPFERVEVNQEEIPQTPPSTQLVTTGPTGSSNEVGITEGQLSVSLTGAATYSIPIAVPPGINEVVPKISLAYNSQAGNGLAGFGWNISGISVISRIPSTKFHDDIIDPVDFDEYDRYALDGERLILKNNTQIYGGNGSEYETENFSNIKITSIGVHPSGTNYGPAMLKVEYPDGSIAMYGETDNSRSITQYAISWWQNPQGVRIIYTYILTNNVPSISKIQYGSTYNNTPINEVLFEYFPNARLRPEQAYIGGQSLIHTKLLKAIHIIGNNVGFRNYYLGYNVTSLGYQRLTQITEKNGDESKSYNPTLFDYDTTGTTDFMSASPLIPTTFAGLNSENSRSVTGDYDGDGAQDMIIFFKTGVFAYSKYWLLTDLKGTSVNLGTLHNVGAFLDIFPVTWTSLTNKLMPMEGWCITKKINATDYTFTTHYTDIHDPISSSQSLYPPIYVQNVKTVTLPALNVPRRIISGDFNGDTITDAMIIDMYNPYVRKVYFVNLKRDLTVDFWNYAGDLTGAINDQTNVQVLDFNGDGKLDFIILELSKATVYGLDNDNNLIVLTTIISEGVKVDKPALFGDYNGDGKSDFVIPQVDNFDNWYFYLSTGTTFEIVPSVIGTEYSTSVIGYLNINGDLATKSLVEYSYIPIELNGDGKTDIMLQANITVYYSPSLDPGTPQITDFFLLENKGRNGTMMSFQGTGFHSQAANIHKSPISIFTNPNRQNLSLEYGLLSNDRITSFTCPKDNKKDVLLKSITTGNGVTQLITYKSLKEESVNSLNSPNIYFPEKNFLESYPNMDVLIAPGFKVVSKVEKRSSDTYKFQLYTYYGAVTNVGGIGFQGFRGTMRTNFLENSSSPMLCTVSKYDISLRGAASETFSAINLWSPASVSPTTSYISKTVNTFNTDNVTGIFTSPLLSNKVFKLNASKLTQYNGFDNTSSIVTTQYNNYNNPTSSTITLKNGSTVEQITNNTINYVPNSITPYVVGRPQDKTNVITTDPNGPNQLITSSEEVFTFNDNLLTEVKKRVSSSSSTPNTPYLSEKNEYDPWGNITKKTTSYPGLVDRVTEYEYDLDTHRFLVKSYDVEHQATEFTYDQSSGVLLTELLPSKPNFPLLTTYEYDSWFKKKKTLDYLGKSIDFTYFRLNEKTLITSTGTDGNISTELYDDLGRKIQSGATNINGNFAYNSYLYDVHDRNYKVSEPYFGINTPLSQLQWNETQFDGYGRKIKSISFKGKIAEIEYNGLTTTVSEKTSTGITLKTKTSIKNSIGQVISTTDAPGGTINYTYFASGALKTTSYNNNTTTVTLDQWGNKKTLTDTSAGLYEYTYNGFGEILSEKTPNGLTTYESDDYGKLIKKTIVGNLTNSELTNIYDPNTKQLKETKYDDLLTSSSTTSHFVYDDYKRLALSDESNQQFYFQRATIYDDYGRAEKELYQANNLSDGKSSAKWIKNTYKNGYLWQIIDEISGEMQWQVDDVDARGSLKSAQFGTVNGVPLGIESHIYDAYGLPSNTNFRIQNGSNASNLPFMTLTTNFNHERGNLDNRNYSFNGTTETFLYDYQDRLYSYPRENGQITTQTYDDTGRITNNYLGEYRYDANKPYRSTGIKIIDPSVTLYYKLRTPQVIGYNAIKKPVTISELNHEKIDFEYNGSNSRMIMYYGNEEDNKNLRTYRKFYSADGGMEIKTNINGGTEFLFYIGGNGYSAPVVLKSDGTTQNYLYLHRDYQGSILAISNSSGQVVERRAFDAWGSLIKYWNIGGVTTVPTAAGIMLLDRGYTGHEHLLGVALINMNGRLYDPKLHRFLSPDNFVQDPSNTQSFNRYGYCWNNPLKYADYTGEWFGWDDLVVAAFSFVISYVSSGIMTKDWGWKSVQSGLIGAVSGWLAYNSAGASTGIEAGSGVLSTPMWNFVITSAATTAVSCFIPPMGIDIGDFSLSVSPAIAFGSVTGGGFAISATYSSGDFSFSAGVGIMSNSTYHNLGKNDLEVRKSLLANYDDGKTGISLGTNFWRGDFKQETGVVGIHSGDFRAMYENDGGPILKHLGDANDSFRTAALNLSVGEFSAGFNLFTGRRDQADQFSEIPGQANCWDENGVFHKYNYTNEQDTKYRLGALTVGYGGYRVGVNSEHVRHAIQNSIIHRMIKDREFENTSWDWKGFSQYKSPNTFTSW